MEILAKKNFRLTKRIKDNKTITIYEGIFIYPPDFIAGSPKFRLNNI